MADEVKNKILLVDLQCFPCINYYRTLVYHDKLRFEQYDHFEKGSYRNRYYIAGPHGRILLSVPLLHSRRERTPLRDLKICNLDRWQGLHWKTLVSAYRRSPWFEFYEEELAPLYVKKFHYLLDWNLEAFALLGKWLDHSWDVSFTDDYLERYPEENLTDGRNQVIPKNSLKEPQAKGGLYHQVFEDRTGFLPGLSILDLLFCEGKRAPAFLLSREFPEDEQEVSKG